MDRANEPVLSVRDLVVHLRSVEGAVRAVDGVSFDIRPGETFGLVGESGCGKSVTALSLLGLIPQGQIQHRSGQVMLEGEDLLHVPARRMRKLRGDRIAMIFQEPMTSLNPVLTVGRQIAESLIRHRGLGRDAAHREAIALLARVGIPAPKERASDYPHRLSGGMRQRVMIAMAIACDPVLLVADEPTTALDVTIQAQILNLIDSLKSELGMAVLLITHNFGIVAQTADRTAVMYAGRIVETAPTVDLFDKPSHPYTRGLLNAIPELGDSVRHGRRPLQEIAGMVPRLTAPRHHCSFAPRCDWRFGHCFTAEPAMSAVDPGHGVRCFAQDPAERERGAEERVPA